ncbi:MAG: tRNA (N6-threonylcarbamoyladenosine(37)-N6)-methyltransferase TrmO, partial [Calditrichia bacterium]
LCRPIGIINTPFKEPAGTPIQPAAGKGVKGTVFVFPEYREGLRDLEGFSHIILLYHFHMNHKEMLMVTPYLDSRLRGVFATRAPVRPNHIGLSVVRLMAIEEGVLHIQDLDMVDGTPLLDIKPYVPEFDHRGNIRIGWLEKNVPRLPDTKSDDRFKKE